MNNWKQMELFPSTLSREDILVNHSPSQVANLVKKIKDISGQKCLDLSRNAGRLGSLEKTLVDTLNSVLTPYLRTWRVKVTPRGRLVFQLLASAQTTKEKESGLWATPNTMDHLPQRSPEALRRQATTTRKGRTKPANLREQVDPTVVRMWRTPDAHCDRGPSSKERMQMKLDKKMPISLNDQVRHLGMAFPTPTARDYKDSGPNTNYEKARKKGRLAGSAGGSLNPMWVEWLMGFPKGWTDLKD